MIHVSVHVAPVCGALSHGDHGNLRLLKFFIRRMTNWGIQCIFVTDCYKNLCCSTRQYALTVLEEVTEPEKVFTGEIARVGSMKNQKPLVF